ncbi:MAG: outer membrane protein transport protein [Betaproteobacteria bacterium]|nr:outer membrane protein transport protein [Betaproteobacteria bacterium]
MKQKRIACLVLSAIGATTAGSAFASGFQLLEQSAAGLGSAFAGSGVVTDDPSVGFFNPASMPFMAQRNQISAGVVMIKPNMKFENGNSSAPPGITNVGGDVGDAAPWAGVPNVHASYAINDQISIGFSGGGPFGLRTNYDPEWRGRFLADKSDLKAKNFNPSIAYRFNDMVSVGAGVSYQTFDAELTQAVNFSAAMCANPSVAALCGAGLLNNNEGFSSVKGSSNAWGWNMGVTLQLSQSTRVGASYRSAIKHHLTGDATFYYPNVTLPSAVPGGSVIAGGLNQAIRAGLPSGPISVDVKLPETWIISTFQQLDEKWTLQGDISWTGWSSLQSLDIYRSNGALLSSTPYNWRDTWRIALGGSYKLNDSWKLRAGIAFDQSPVTDDNRHARLPDNNRKWLSIGARWQATHAIALDAGYAHLFMSKTPINETTGVDSGAGTLVGEYTGSVDIVGLQVSYAF